jgi:threonine synthase
MKSNLTDFAAGYATEAEVKEKIAEVYAKTGYVMDTHTAVAAFVADRYRKNTGDTRKTVVASTASPYKFVKSVMTAIDTKYETQDEMELLSILNDVSGVDVPNAIKEIMNAEVLHTLECDADKMEETVKMILG